MISEINEEPIRNAKFMLSSADNYLSAAKSILKRVMDETPDGEANEVLCSLIERIEDLNVDQAITDLEDLL